MDTTNCPLSINRTHCVDALIEQSSPLFLKAAKKVFQRDNYNCQLCGFHSKKYQQVICKNGRYTDKDFVDENLITVCPSCFLGQRLGHSAIGDKITFVYLPELSQGELNHLMRLIYHYLELSSGDDSNNADLTAQQQSLKDCQGYAEGLLMELRDRSRYVRKAYNHLTLDRLKSIVTMLYERTDEEYAKRNKFFEPIRYLVSPQIMVELNNIYKDEVFAKLDGHNEVMKSALLKLGL